MVQKIRWTIRSLSDLKDIYDFIARDSERYAQIQIEHIQDAVSNLSQFPFMGHKLPEFPHSPYREILIGNYRAIYKFKENEDQIIVMAIVHVRRLLKEL